MQFFTCLLFFCFGVACCAETVFVFDTKPADEVTRAKLDDAFNAVYAGFNKSFDRRQFQSAMALLNQSVAEQTGNDGQYGSHMLRPSSAHCDLRKPALTALQAGLGQIAPYPGGSTQSAGDYSKEMANLAASATGPGAAGSILPNVLAKQALTQGLGMVRQMCITSLLHPSQLTRRCLRKVQTIIAAVVDLVCPP